MPVEGWKLPPDVMIENTLRRVRAHSARSGKFVSRLAPPPQLKRRRATTMLSTNSAAPEGLPDLAGLTSDPALGRRLEAFRGYLTILARMQIGRRLQGKVDAADVVQE